MINVLVIGASGLVGSHCSHYLREKNLNIIGTHLNYKTSETHYFNPLEDNAFDFLNQFSFIPDAIIHCAALTNVDYCEENEEESYEKTVLSTQKVVTYCLERNIKLVYISTDYVFDGKEGPYKETDRVNPINIYGRHKLEAEMMVQLIENFIIVRITNVYGEEERSKNFIAFLLGVLNKNELRQIKLPFDQFATPIYANDIAKMIFLLLKDNKKGIYHFASTDYYNRYQLALKVASFFPNDKNLQIQPVLTDDFHQKARRPLNGGLLNNKFSNEYPEFKNTNIDSFILKNLKINKSLIPSLDANI